MDSNISFGRISDNVYYFSGFEDDVGAGFITSEEGIIVVDTTMLPTSAETLMGTIKMLCPEARVTTIINTHVHVDHHFGNETFIRRYPDAKIIAHERFLGMLNEWAIESGKDVSVDLPLRMIQREDMLPYHPYFKGLKVIPPTRTVSTDFTMQCGDTTIQLLHTPGHTEDSLSVYLPEDKILFASDSIYPTKRIPVLFMGDPDTWIHSLEKLFTLDIKVLLPGHGWIPEDPQAEIKRHIEALGQVRARIIDIIQKAGGRISYAELEQRIDFLKGRNLLGAIRAFVKRGVLKANNKDISKAELELQSS